jgi:hypothetical protein
MFIQQLFEGEIKRVIAIYPGRFQPFHLGHKEVFQALQAKFGMDNVFIGTSNKTDADKSPFNFSDKLQLMTAAGVNNHHVIEVASPYMPDDYIRTIGFNPAETVLIFAVGAPDLKRLEVDAHYTALTPTGRPSKIPNGKSVGDPKPFKTFQSLQDCVTADQHQYVLIVNEREKKVTVNGKEFDASHGTQVRQLWNEVRNDPQTSAQVLQQLYGHATPELAHIFNKIPDANAAPAPVPAAAPKLKAVKQPKQDISKELKEAMLTEAMLQEAFIDSIAQVLGNKLKAPVTHVANMAQALQVLYRTASDPKHLETMTFLLKKRLAQLIKSLPPILDKLKQLLVSMIPQGRGIGDFIKALLLVAVAKTGTAISMTLQDEAKEAFFAQFLRTVAQIPELVGSVLSTGVSALGNVLQALKIGNTVWFELLNEINSKIEWANKTFPGVGSPSPAGAVSLAKPAMAEDAAGVGVIASKKQKNDPRYSMSMTQDVGPGEDKKNMKKLHLESNRGYTQGFASPTAPSLGGSRRREDDEYHVPDPTPSTWYIRANGKIIKDKMGTPYQYRDKETARKAAMTMMSKPFNAGKKFILTTKPEDEAPVTEGTGPATHRIGLTVTDPNHPMVSKRGDTYHKTVRITQNVSDREAAINQAIAHYRRKGYKVHDHHYIGTVDDEPINELSPKTLGSYAKKAAVDAKFLGHQAGAQQGDAMAHAKRPGDGVDAGSEMDDRAHKRLKGVGRAVDKLSGVNEFAPPGGDSGNDGFSDDTLKRMAAQWYHGDEDPRVEKTLAAAGWEIGQDEGYDDEPGVFVVQAGDVNGNSYMSWPAQELQGLSEGAELKQAKRKYNQAAKDANDDQVGAGKKIDTMKKSLRQKDLDNKKEIEEGATGAKPGWMLRQDPALAKKVKDSKAGHQALKKWAGKPVPKDDKQDVAEGVAETMPMDDAVKVLRHYGAGHFKTTSNELHFYNKNGQPMSVDLIWGNSGERSVSLSQLNSVSRQLKGQGVAEGGLGLDHKRNRFKSLDMRENAEELNIGDPVIITGKGIEFEGKTGDIDSFGDMKRFVVVNLYNHGKHSFHSSDVSYNDYADEQDDEDYYALPMPNGDRDLDEDMYQYDAQDPYNSEFAPRAGMGRMTLRGWKQQMIKRTAELAQQMAAAGQDIDKSALWDNVYAKLKSMNMDPIAQEIEQAQAELEKIRQRGGVRSRAFNK